MTDKFVIVIDNKVSRLELVEDIIRHVDPTAPCVAFLFGDEALRMINMEMSHPPSHIFIDANLRRTSISSCLHALRSNPRLDGCCITVTSETMPMAVADAYCNMGADFAIATPITLATGVDLLQGILAATRHAIVDR